ncbi:class I SAM-dependent methyltransferase [Streptomyces sp. NPDC048361]|uniref:class I SAM-dependent methyltransferase n=1 Tax=Streptomyces sp. NPDC048361 TaxID=3154720 RepID=UPI00344264B7
MVLHRRSTLGLRGAIREVPPEKCRPARRMNPCHDAAVPINHNVHYHDLLLRELPSSCRTALDVGCGTGEFARKLARRGIEVDALDADRHVIDAAREQTAALDPPRNITFAQADIRQLALPPGT